jgi:HEAT repeat protein
MAEDPNPIDLAARYAAFIGSMTAGQRAELLTAADAHGDARVRGAALGALMRSGGERSARVAWSRAVGDPAAAVRRRSAELAPTLRPAPLRGLLTLLADADPFVAETAAWALGEASWAGQSRTRVVRALTTAAGEHPDPLVRESAVAALGAIGDVRGLPAILTACGDRPPIRRRAVLALAPFEGPSVDAALEQALADPDWQVRQAAEDLSPPPG